MTQSLQTDEPSLAEFPEVSDRMQHALNRLELLQLGGPAANEIFASGEILPRPWDLTTIHDPELRSDTWTWLDAFVIWFNTQHTWLSGDQVPPCWAQHPHLVHEIGTLADQRRIAGEAPTSTPLDEWHRYTAPAFLERTRPTRTGCEEKHMPWPGRAAHLRHIGRASRQKREGSITLDIPDLACEHPALRYP